MKQTNESIKVADSIQIGVGYTVTGDYSAIEHFNKRVLPMLDYLGLFSSRRIQDYVGMTRKYVFAAYMRKMAAEGSRLPLQADMGAFESAEKLEKRFDELWEKGNWSIDVKIPSEQGMKFVQFDEQSQRFVIDMDSYRSSISAIYASTPEELKALELLRAAADALSQLHLDTLNPHSFKPTNQICLDYFFTIGADGKVELLKAMLPGPWRDLVSRVNQK